MVGWGRHVPANHEVSMFERNGPLIGRALETFTFVSQSELARGMTSALERAWTAHGRVGMDAMSVVCGEGQEGATTRTSTTGSALFTEWTTSTGSGYYAVFIQVPISDTKHPGRSLIKKIMSKYHALSS